MQMLLADCKLLYKRLEKILCIKKYSILSCILLLQTLPYYSSTFSDFIFSLAPEAFWFILQASWGKVVSLLVLSTIRR